MRDWDPAFLTHYDNARETWSDILDRLVFQDLPVGSPTLPAVLVVRSGSVDESKFDDAVGTAGFMFTERECPNEPDQWSHVSFAESVTVDGHLHFNIQKICVEGDGNGPYAPNQGDAEPAHYNFRYLTLLHEMGHVLSLPDLYGDANACLMHSGFDMRYPCATEVEFVATHYGTAGGFHP